MLQWLLKLSYIANASASLGSCFVGAETELPADYQKPEPLNEDVVSLCFFYRS